MPVGTMAQDRDRFRCFDMCDMIIPFTVVPRDNAVGRAAKARQSRRTARCMEVCYPESRA